MPNLDEYVNRIKITSDIIKKAAKGVESIKNAAMSWENNIDRAYQKDEAEKTAQKSDIEDDRVDKDIRTAKAIDNSDEDNILKVDFNETNLAQAFIYSEIFGKPKSLRRGR